MATTSPSTVSRNEETAALTGQPKERLTLESIQRDTAALFVAKQNEISRLEKLLEDRDAEIGELKIKYFKVLSEKKATERELLQSRGNIETDADRELPVQRNAVQGLQSDLTKDAAERDGDSHHEDDRVRLGGQHPESYKSAKKSQSSQETKDSNDRYSLQKRVAVSQGNANASVKSASSKMMGASAVYMDNMATLDMVDWLADNITVKDWKPLLRKLGLSDGKIEDIVCAYPSMIREQRYQGFKEWKKISRSKGTVSALLSAMDKLSLQQNIREFCQEFKVKRESGFQVETDSVPQDFSSPLHELIEPDLARKFEELEDGLRHLDNLSEQLCVTLKYPLTLDTGRQGATVLSVLEHCSKEILQKYPNPGDKTRRHQELQSVVQRCGTGVRAELKKYVVAGVVGPLNREIDLRATRSSILSKVEEMLSVDYDGTKNWKDLTSWLKTKHAGVFQEVDRYKIDLWEKNKEPRTGAHNILQVWMTTTKATEGKLYDWLVDNGRNDIAKFLE